MKRALVKDGHVVQVVAVGQEFEVHASMSWIDCSDSCVPGWQVNGGVASAPAVTLAEAKAAKKAEIRAARDAEEKSGFTYLGKQFDSTPDVLNRIYGAVLAAQAAIAAGQGGAFSLVWTCADDSTITLSASDLVAMPIAMATTANTLHTKARNLIAQVDAATTNAQVAEVVW